VLKIEGSNKALQNLGTYLFAVIGLGIAMLVTWVMMKLRDRFELIRTLTDALMRKLFYNSILRYAI
jgi:uncharacterized membrane protein YgaE (UPF0421/DUF939 family)